jgi:hypothetical protein
MLFLLPDMKIQVFPDLSPEWGGKNDFLMRQAEDYFSPDIQRMRLSP